MPAALQTAGGHQGNLTTGRRGSGELAIPKETGFSPLHSQTRREVLGRGSRSKAETEALGFALAFLSCLSSGHVGSAQGPSVINVM